MSEIEKFNNDESPFDVLRHEDERGEYWSARELAQAIGYKEWRNFEKCVLQALEAVTDLQGVDAGQANVGEVTRVVTRDGRGSITIKDYRLTRYGAYMALSYSNKPELKHYFVTKTREAEVRQAFDPSSLTRKQILTMALEAEERAEQAIAQRDEMRSIVEVNEPKVAAYDAFIERDGLFGIRRVAQLLNNEGFNVKERTLVALLKEWAIIEKRGNSNRITATHVNAGRGKNVPGVTRDGYNYVQGKFTSKGVDYLIKKIHGWGDARKRAS